MNKTLLRLSFVALILMGCSSSKTNSNDLAISNPIVTSLDLTKVSDDKVPVTINPGRFTEETVTFHLPRVVQGTYSVSDFGKYIDDFKAYDYKGNVMPSKKTDTNSWIIDNAANLDYITYYVNDTFDIETTGGIGGEQPFSPAGTNIEPDNYVLNLHGFVGYFDSLENSQYEVDITAPSDFDYSSALQVLKTTTSVDGKSTTYSYYAPRYFDVTDNPMMYGKFSKKEFQVGDIKVVLSVYSPTGKHTADEMSSAMEKMIKAQKAYLGEINSTPRYDIFVYLSRGDNKSPKGFGALEHHKSTVVVFPDAMPKEALDESMIDVVSHEFFHILTPLSVHSEDVHYFDYNDPTFSKHLWMYEGLTEYFATLFQVNQGLASEQQFYNKIIGKINSASSYDDTMSFTTMSENILDEPYASNYINVYSKGALIGMCVDIILREESNGTRGILSLMKELSNKYGVNKPFEDDKLIDEIVSMTYPSLRDFFDKHVIGTEPIDYNVYFKKVGLTIGEGQIETNYILNGNQIIVSANPQKGTIFFTDAVSANSFWSDNGAQPNDVIKKINGEDVTLASANAIFQQVFMWQPGADVDVLLDRNGEEIEIKTTLTQSYTLGTSLMDDPDATSEQVALRKAWLKG